ncbi:primosomal protein N' [Wenjunlia tyrosinilytica]|uniref:Probable replication restart protein PriA n=1 Tax=Wenjunlia tyrosinilytica TaxID=1544741 RepID=A0A918DTW8_9ACTN|nr:primosomal protein N' [Wenjunlia tyrosinilytica]GGO82273.1 putative primosomal protein N' [Wenjunlia tyrosinilytica]
MSSENGGEGQGQEGPEQLALIREAVRKAKPRARKAVPTAERLPVARVAVDKALSHLDRLYDYSVPSSMDADAVPGARVRVRFGGHVAKADKGRRTGGRLVDGYIVERRESSDYRGPLAPLASVLSPEPVLSPDLLALARSVADRYAGTLADVLQLAVPPRHGRAEAEPSPEPRPAPDPPEPGTWSRYPAGSAFLQALRRGDTPRAVWTALPGPHWPQELARAVVATLASGRGALVVVPDGRAAARVDAALSSLVGEGHHVVLTAESGPRERYRRWLALSRGAVRAVVGTRAAMFAPVRDPGLVALWDDGDSSHSEQHAPQPHARDVLVLRAANERTGFLLGGLTCTAEGAQLVDTRWALPLAAPREALRAAAPLVRTVGDNDQARDAAARAARLPSLAWQITRDALERGPVLVQVPRRGYVPRLACERCREPAHCQVCAGPLEIRDEDGVLHCAWCGRPETAWHCLACGSTRLRAQVVGARRTADELGRAFPKVPVRTSGRDGVIASVPGRPSLVISTPGAEPVAEGGYAAALLLDGWALLNRPDLRAGEEALRRWLGAAALVRPQSEGGTVVVVAEPSLRPVQALVRWDPAGHAVRELAERAQLGFPPVSRMAAVTGKPAAVADLLATTPLPDDTDILGPVPAPPTAQWGDEPLERVLLRVRPGQGAALAAALKSAQAVRIARKEPDPVRVRIDPPDIG